LLMLLCLSVNTTVFISMVTAFRWWRYYRIHLRNSLIRHNSITDCRKFRASSMAWLSLAWYGVCVRIH
jgi:hypothetical protein